MIDIINWEILLKGMLIAWLYVNFKPFKPAREWIKTKFRWGYLKEMIGCFKCISFWVVLFWSSIELQTFDIYTATVAAIIAYTYLKIMGGIRTFI